MEEASPEPEPEDNWALGKGIELYEVSSKDDQGLRSFFAAFLHPGSAFMADRQLTDVSTSFRPC